MGVSLAYSITGILHSIWGTSNLSIISSKHTHVKDWEPDCFTALQNVIQYAGLEFQMDNSMLGVSHEMKAINHDRLNKGLNGDPIPLPPRLVANCMIMNAVHSNDARGLYVLLGLDANLSIANVRSLLVIGYDAIRSCKQVPWNHNALPIST